MSKHAPELMTNFDCGCVVYTYMDEEANEYADFQYCPLHKAAPALLEACKMLLKHYLTGITVATDESYLTLSEYDEAMNAMGEAQAAIRLATEDTDE